MAQPNNTQRFVHYTGALFLLVAAVFVGAQLFMPSWFKNIKAEVTNQPYARTITVDGEAKISEKPDLAVVSLSVVSQGKTVKEVMDDSNTKMNKVIEEIKKLNIDAKDITTSQFNLSPEYDYSKVDPTRNIIYPPSSAGTLVGYRLNQEVTVKVRDLEKADDVLDKSTAAGANQVGQLYFTIDDTSEVKKKAREMAFEAAKEKAEQMANAAGVKLGRVVTFSEGGTFQPYANAVMNYAKSVEDTGAALTTLEPGSQEIRLNVSVTYEIE